MMQENKNTDQELTFVSAMPESSVPVEQKAQIESPMKEANLLNSNPPVISSPPVNIAQLEPLVQNFVEEKIPVQPIFYAGFWKRVAILYLDTLFSPLFLINIILYFAKGKTIGDFIMQTKLVDELDYKKPGFGKLIGRYLAKILSSFALNIGFLCVGWRKSKTAWHDSLSGTRYVETKQYSGAITWIVNLILFFGIPYFAYSTPIIQNNIGTVMNLFESTLNDSVENSIIPVEWFEAAIDAHKKLGFKPKGQKIVSHDPSDLGDDAKGLCYRHGSVVLDIQELITGDVNDGCDWATDYAITKAADLFVWDGDGLGVSLEDYWAEGKDDYE